MNANLTAQAINDAATECIADKYGVQVETARNVILQGGAILPGIVEEYRRLVHVGTLGAIDLFRIGGVALP